MQIRTERGIVYRNPAPLFVTVKFWAGEFERSDTSLVDAQNVRWLQKATTINSARKVHQMVLDY